MADTAAEINERFASANGNSSLPEDVQGELQSILRLHSIDTQELFYKWESYSIKMGSEGVKLDLGTVRDFKKDLQETLERETRSKHARASERRAAGATPRNARGGDMFGMIDGISPGTPRGAPMRATSGNTTKRKSNFDTPAHKAPKPHAGSSPNGPKETPFGQTVPFANREKAGEVLETLNEQIPAVGERQLALEESRLALAAKSDKDRYSYKPMAVKLTEASERLDDRIEDFMELVQTAHGLEAGAFGNPASMTNNEIVAVGRVASDSGEGKLNPSSIVLETSRSMGGGFRVPLDLSGVAGFDFFAGKIVALRGSNASGEQFTVSEIIELPSAYMEGSAPSKLDEFKARVAAGADETDIAPLNIIVSSGPYTADNNLDFEPLHELCNKAAATCADAVIMLGPFLDTEHPLLAAGQLPSFPPGLNLNPDTATMSDIFHACISIPLQRLAQTLKGIKIIMVPSVRDAISKHICWPQDLFTKSRQELGLPRQAVLAYNPFMLFLNEMMFGFCSQDVLNELRQESCVAGDKQKHGLGMFERLTKHLIEQRHFYPVFPPVSREALPKPTPNLMDWDSSTKSVGGMLDTSNMLVGQWPTTKPDVLITPSSLTPFARVVDSVVCINPGPLSKKRGAGTYAQMSILPKSVSPEERSQEMVAHEVYSRARVDVVRI